MRPIQIEGTTAAAPVESLVMAVTDEVAAQLETFLAEDAKKDLLRLSTAGSVDDGKSTLIGRLLYDTKMVYEDHLAAVQASKVNRASGPIDFSLLTDGLKAEREQGITIDVAYRYFQTTRRKFIIADTPGHEQYTRNMATGASTADLAVILVDARLGVLPQSRRHAYIAALLGIPHVAVAVNKMDLVGFDEQVFDRIRDEFGSFMKRVGLQKPVFFPISALDGDNVVDRSERTPWYGGPSLLEHLETVPIGHDRESEELRFPVQYVIRPDLHFRGYAGTVASGVIKKGDPIRVLPSGRTSRVKSVVTWEGEIGEAHPPMAVTVTLEDEVDVSRGDMLVHPYQLPKVSRRLEAMVVWMHQDPLLPGKEYFLKHTTQTVRAKVTALRYRVNINSLAEEPAGRLDLNELASIEIETNRSLYFDPYRENRATGNFILIDPDTNGTVGACMIVAERQPGEQPGHPAEGTAVAVTLTERITQLGHSPAALFVEGAAERAWAVERKLFDREVFAVCLPSGGSAWREKAEALLGAGAIVVLTGHPIAEEDQAALEAVAGPEHFFAPEARALARNDARAAQQIVDELERRRWIRPAARFGVGEGI